MSEQLALAGVPEPPPKLKDRQRLIYELARQHPEGVTAEQVGAYLHSKRPRRPHPADVVCEWCRADALQALRTKALKPLLVRRRDGRWYLRDRSAYVRPAGGVIATSDPNPATNPWADL